MIEYSSLIALQILHADSRVIAWSALCVLQQSMLATVEPDVSV